MAAPFGERFAQDKATARYEPVAHPGIGGDSPHRRGYAPDTQPSSSLH
ncbi:MAG: hypothetical protein GY796_05950 [Chloroflexi bacterium]|nr:hypothetical protein [Chloroflexota bacterium]